MSEFMTTPLTQSEGHTRPNLGNILNPWGHSRSLGTEKSQQLQRNTIVSSLLHNLSAI
jgi:hypothetical protein